MALLFFLSVGPSSTTSSRSTVGVLDLAYTLASDPYMSSGNEFLYIVCAVGVVFFLIAGIAIYKDQTK